MSAWFLNGLNCVVPDRDIAGPEAGKALSVWWPVGREPARAYVLVTTEDLNQHLAAVDDAFTLTITDQIDGRPVAFRNIENLYWIKSIRVGGGVPDAGGDHLVELADIRLFWQRFSYIDASYNVRRPATTTDDPTAHEFYYTDSLHGAAVWDWEEMLTDMWSNLPGGSGFPGLPFTPDAPPTNFRFKGVNAWEAINQVLDRLNCIPILNPFDGTWDVVSLRLEQAGLADSETALAGRWLDHADPHQSNAARYPENVRVCFNKQAKHYGTEKDADDVGNWDLLAVYTKDTAIGKTGAIAGTVAVVWDDLPEEVAFDGSRENQTELDARAAEIAARWIAAQENSELQRIVYSGLTSRILPGSQIKAVRWSQHGAGGITTETIRHDGTPRGEAAGRASLNENLTGPDYARKTFPNWPRLLQVVQVDDGESGDGESIDATGDGLWPGYVYRFDPETSPVGSNDAWGQGVPCWIAAVNYPIGGSYDSATKLKNKQRFLARLNGAATTDDDRRPLYLIENQPLDIGYVEWSVESWDNIVSPPETSYSGGVATGSITVDGGTGTLVLPTGKFIIWSEATFTPGLASRTLPQHFPAVNDDTGHVTLSVPADQSAVNGVIDAINARFTSVLDQILSNGIYWYCRQTLNAGSMSAYCLAGHCGGSIEDLALPGSCTAIGYEGTGGITLAASVEADGGGDWDASWTATAVAGKIIVWRVG